MTDNEKAAVAAGLWQPVDKTVAGANWNDAAPDMHDPANLWRAVEKRRIQLVPAKDGSWAAFTPVAHAGHDASAADAVLTALVALYDTEHPEATCQTSTR